MRQEERKAREERKASRVAAARWGPEPRPRDSEPDLIGVGRRELKRGGQSAGGSGRRGAQVRQRKGPDSRGGPLTARQALLPGPGSRRPGTRCGPRPTTTPGSPLPPPPPLFSPAPTGPALTQGRRSGPGLRVTYVDVLRQRAGLRLTRTPTKRRPLRKRATPPPAPASGGRSQARGLTLGEGEAVAANARGRKSGQRGGGWAGSEPGCNRGGDLNHRLSTSTPTAVLQV